VQPPHSIATLPLSSTHGLAQKGSQLVAASATTDSIFNFTQRGREDLFSRLHARL
jgi:hypothetical protein